MGYTVNWLPRRVSVIYSGHCTETEVLNAVVQLQSDYRFDSTNQALHDFSQCESLSPSPEHLQELAGRNVGAAVSNPKLRIAVISSRPDVLGMLERFNSLGLSPYPLRTFANAESANAWLDRTA